MAYLVKELFYSLQGEGAQVGRPAVFCRFAGCNLWTGREQDRATATCRFCDTDFRGIDGPGGGRFISAAELADAITGLWPAGANEAAQRWAICTGGEPLLQLDDLLIDALHERGFAVAIETNGTIPAPAGLDWVCVSPKAGASLALLAGDELKLIYPQAGIDIGELEALNFEYRFVQPMDGPDLRTNTRAAVQWCLAHPAWRLSLQTHKILEIQ